MLRDFAILYLTSILYKIICLQFFICTILSVLLFHAFVSRPQSVIYDVILLKTLRMHAPETLNPYSSHQR